MLYLFSRNFSALYAERMKALYDNLSVGVVIAAGGKGNRMAAGIAKQFLTIGEKSIIGITLETFIQNPFIDEIAVVLPDGDIDYFLRSILPTINSNKVKHTVTGGAARQDSVRKGLLALSKSTDIVLVHDAVRPFVTPNIINAVIEGAAKYKSCVPAVKIKDTVKIAEDGFVNASVNRETLYAIQTPQGFDYNMIIQAHDSAVRDNVSVTDDASLAERFGTRTKIVEGSYQNIKITTKEDLCFAEAIYAELSVN